MEDPIKKKIQELCPDVMELKFGCQFKLINDSFFQEELQKRFGTQIYTYDGLSRLLCEHGWLDFSDMYIFRKDAWEILGSPITLAVVLRAMSKVGVMTEGANKLINIADVNAPDIRWNLINDSYDVQTKETQLFIGSLLGV